MAGHLGRKTLLGKIAGRTVALLGRMVGLLGKMAGFSGKKNDHL